VPVKRNKILVNQAISGKNVFIWSYANQRTYLVKAVIGDSLAIPDHDKEQINKQFMVGKTGPETLSEKTMADPGETTVNFSDSMADEWRFLDHETLPMEKYGYQKHREPGFHIFGRGIGRQLLQSFRKNGSKVHLKIDFDGRLSHWK